LLYQHPRIQQTKGGVKNKKRKTNLKASRVKRQHFLYSAFDFDLVHLSKPFIQHRYHGLSVPACLSVFCEFWRSMITMLDKWEPLLFRGVAVVAAFSGYSLWL